MTVSPQKALDQSEQSKLGHKPSTQLTRSAPWWRFHHKRVQYIEELWRHRSRDGSRPIRMSPCGAPGDSMTAKECDFWSFMLIYASSCDVIGHVTSLDPWEWTPRGAPWWWNCYRPIRCLPKSAHLSDNRGLYGGAPGGNKRTTNQNAPFQISTNQKLTQICTFLLIQMPPYTTTI